MEQQETEMKLWSNKWFYENATFEELVDKDV
jgi:hypothetical protein